MFLASVVELRENGEQRGSTVTLTRSRKSAPMLTSPEGKRMQARVWKEIISILVEPVPEVEDIAW